MSNPPSAREQVERAVKAFAAFGARLDQTNRDLLSLLQGCVELSHAVSAYLEVKREPSVRVLGADLQAHAKRMDDAEIGLLRSCDELLNTAGAMALREEIEPIYTAPLLGVAR